jgi:hypothetical protein
MGAGKVSVLLAPHSLLLILGALAAGIACGLIVTWPLIARVRDASRGKQ